jgi:hypothetical protein
MVPQLRQRRFLGTALISLAMTGWFAVFPVRGADLDKLDTSMSLVPGDAAFYSAMLRNREQLDILLKSNAVAKLKALPAVQTLWKQAETQMEEPLSRIRQFYQQPENQELIALLADMAGQEIFCYGGPNSADFVDLLAQLYGTAQFQRVFSRMQGLAGAEEQTKAQIQALLDTLTENPGLLKVPDLVLGFKITDAKRAQAQMNRLEKLWQDQVEQIPPLKGRLKRAKVGGDDFLTLTLDGQMVPWDQIPFKDFEEKPGQYDDLVKKLKQMKLTVSLGVRGKYLLLAVGASSAHVTQLSKGPNRLADRAELKPLARFADRRITGINYSSKALQAKAGMSKNDLNDLSKTVSDWLGQAGEMTDAQKKQLKKDLDDLAKDLKKFIPEPGATLGFSFLTDRGQESYQYDWSENLTADGSKPLTLLNHVGGAPILATVGRSKYSPEDYQLLVKWIKVANRYAEQFLVAKLEPEPKEKYEKLVKTIQPLLKRLDEVTSKMLLPALADGQAGLVLDAKLTSKNWVLLLPPTEQALPMLEPAIVIGVSDAALLRKAMGEYRSIANDLIAKVREVVDEMPEFEIPAPQSRKGKGGDLYSYPLPGNLPLDRRLLPTAALSDKVAALTISNEHAERLLTSTPLKTEGGPLADLKRPLAMATYFNWAGLIDAVAPWVDMGLRMAGPLVDPVIGDVARGDQDLPTQVRTIMNVLRVFRTYTSATYLEDKVLVTHSETVFRDLEK